MSLDVTVGWTFVAGLLSFASPCVLVVALCFVAGFSTVFCSVRGYRASLAAVETIMALTRRHILLGAASFSVIGAKVSQAE